MSVYSRKDWDRLDIDNPFALQSDLDTRWSPWPGQDRSPRRLVEHVVLRRPERATYSWTCITYKKSHCIRSIPLGADKINTSTRSSHHDQCARGIGRVLGMLWNIHTHISTAFVCSHRRCTTSGWGAINFGTLLPLMTSTSIDICLTVATDWSDIDQ